MKPQFPVREVKANGVLSQAHFGISVRSQAHVAAILRDRLYTDKPLAVLREYGANAWDANRMAGRGDRPITVVMPTPLEASLIIRDEGPGLSEEDVYTVYTQYGESTKRDRDDAVGMLGIGSKSAFAYNDAFTITSWHGGAKTVYHAVLDESQLGQVLKVYQGGRNEHVAEFVTATSPPEIEGRTVPSYEWIDLYDLFEVQDLTPYDEAREEARAEFARMGLEDTDANFRIFLATRVKDRFLAWMGENHPDTPTGIEIKVPVVPEDIPEFEEKARNLFRFFKPVPSINIRLNPPETQWETEHGWIAKQERYSSTNHWTLVMGCVPYRINIQHVRAQLEEAGLLGLVQRLSGGLYVDIGEVAIAANREDLEYTKLTKEAIVRRLTSLVESIQSDFDTLVADATKTPFQRRLEVLSFVSRTGLPIPKRHREWATPPKGVLLYRTKAVDDAQEVLRAHAVPSSDGAPDDTLGAPLLNAEGKITDRPPTCFTINKQVDAYGSGGRRKSRQLEEDPYIPVTGTSLRFLIKDSSKPWRGYVANDNDWVVKFKGEHTVEQVEAELVKYMAAANLTGIPVLRMSGMEYVEPARREGEGNPKHGQLCFRLVKSQSSGTLSDNWETATRDADPEDVFVVINRFQVKSGDCRGPDWYDQYTTDALIFKNLFGETMPTVWGLKSVQGHEVNAEEVEGIEYSKWREQAFKDCLARHPELKDEMDALAWTELDIGSLPYVYTREERANHASEQETYEWLRGHLGDKNRVVEVLATRMKAQKVLRDRKEELTKARAADPTKPTIQEYTEARGQLRARLGARDSRAAKWLEVVYSHYPLLRENSHLNQAGLLVFSIKNLRDHWLKYVMMIDTVDPRPAPPARKSKTVAADSTASTAPN